MPQRESTKTKMKVARPQKRITLPIEKERYNEIVDDCQFYRNWLDEMIAKHPELFPENISDGYILHDERSSVKLEGIRLRRIRLKVRDAAGKQQVFTIAPSAIMPYFVGMTDEIEKALFLRRFDVPFWALAYVFGRDDLYWYRLENHLGVTTLSKLSSKTQGNFPSTCWLTKK